MRSTGAERPVVALKPLKEGRAKGAYCLATVQGQPCKREEPGNGAKSYRIPKRLVWEAYKVVRANKGSAGVDEQTLKDFERELKGNLYRVWNRMSSGSYFPPPVRIVEIPKSDGGKRKLGIPTVTDRVAQATCKRVLEPMLEPIFHEDSYGYRPGKSALDAVGATRQRCWKQAWVLDLDIKGFYDSINHELMMKALRKHTESKWILLYVERWLKAEAEWDDGQREKREQGTPQGGVISPLLANLYLHYGFDEKKAKKGSERFYHHFKPNFSA